MLSCGWTHVELCLVWTEVIILWPARHFDGHNWGRWLCRKWPCLWLLVHLPCLSSWMKLLWFVWGMGQTVAIAPSSHVRGFIAVILSVRRQSISAKSHDLPLAHTGQCFFFFANCPSLIYLLASLCDILWHYVCLICTTFIQYPSLIPLGRHSPAAFDPTYIFISCGRPQCSTWGPAAGLKQCFGQGRWQDSEWLGDDMFPSSLPFLF